MALRTVAIFYALALGWSALWGLVPMVGPALAPDVPPPMWFTVAGVPTMFGPLLAAWIVGRRHGLGFADATGIRGRPNRWWIVNWLAPIPFLVAVTLLAMAFPEVSYATPVEAFRARYGLEMPADALAEAEAGLAAVPPFVVLFGGLVGGLLSGATINAVAAFGEEAGWRGFLPRALADAPFWPASLGIGALWGLWHAPLVLQGYNFPDAPLSGLGVMTVTCALLSPPMVWLRGKAGSTIASAIFHGALNGLAGLAFLFTIGGSTLLVSPLGLVAAAVLVVVNVALVAAVPLGARMGDVSGTRPGGPA